MKMISKKDLIFISAIFIVVIVYSLITGGENMDVKFQEEIMSINATNFAFNIAYGDIASAELIPMPELGEMEKGTDSAALKHGNWKNAIWGKYHLCVIPDLPTCVDVMLKDGRHVVFNYKDEDTTRNACTVIQEKLAG